MADSVAVLSTPHCSDVPMYGPYVQYVCGERCQIAEKTPGHAVGQMRLR